MLGCKPRLVFKIALKHNGPVQTYTYRCSQYTATVQIINYLLTYPATNPTNVTVNQLCSRRALLSRFVISTILPFLTQFLTLLVPFSTYSQESFADLHGTGVFSKFRATETMNNQSRVKMGHSRGRSHCTLTINKSFITPINCAKFHPKTNKTAL